MTSNELTGSINLNFRFKLHCGLDRSNRKWLFHLCSIWINAGGWSYCRSSTCYMHFCARPYWKHGSYRLGFLCIDVARICSLDICRLRNRMKDSNLPTWKFINDGCILDETLEILERGPNGELRFTFESFNFHGNTDPIHVQCRYQVRHWGLDLGLLRV